MKDKPKILFSTKRYEPLALAIANLVYADEITLPQPKSIHAIEQKDFPDGESYHRLPDVKDRDVILVGGTTTEAETMEIYDIGSGLSAWHARSITFVIPYFGYSTMERYVKPGEIVKAKNRARLLSSIPHGAIRNQYIFIDLHVAGVEGYFEGNVSTTHLYAENIILQICEAIQKTCGKGEFVLGSTDAGRAKWVEAFASKLKTDCAIITKRRDGGDSTTITSINADVKGKTVTIYDDMIRTGGSLIKAGEAYKKLGAKKVYAIATHAVLPGDSIVKLKTSGVFEKVFVTDTHPRALELADMPSLKGFLEVISVAELIAKSISDRELPAKHAKPIHI